MSRKTENCGFTCGHCGREVLPLTNGSYRNHCPFCLYSRHVDIVPGDRQNQCGGLMQPIAIKHAKKGRQILHQCLKCGKSKPNKVAEDTIQPDCLDAIIAIMTSTTIVIQSRELLYHDEVKHDASRCCDS